MSEQTEPRKRESIWLRPWRVLWWHYFRLMRIEAPPRQVALGLAIGVFVGCLPIVPFQFVTALALAFIFRSSKVAAMIGTLISNPLDFVPFYMMVYYIGRAVTGIEISPPSPSMFHPDNFDLGDLISGSRTLLLVLMTGGFVLAVPSSIVTYFLGLQAVVRYRRRKAARLLKKYGLKLDREGQISARTEADDRPRPGFHRLGLRNRGGAEASKGSGPPKLTD